MKKLSPPDKVEGGYHHCDGQDSCKRAQKHGHPHSIRYLRRRHIVLSQLPEAPVRVHMSMLQMPASRLMLQHTAACLEGCP